MKYLLTTYSSLVTQKQNKDSVLTELSIVEGKTGGSDVRVHSEDVIAALAGEDGRVAPAPAQEQQQHQHHHRERRYRAYVRCRLHCTHQPHSAPRSPHRASSSQTCLPLDGLMTPMLATILAHWEPAGRIAARSADSLHAHCSHLSWMRHSLNISEEYNATIKRTEENNWDVLARSGCQSAAHAPYARGTTGRVEYSARL